MSLHTDSTKIIGVNMISIPEQKAGVGFLAVNLLRELIPKLPHKKFVIYLTKGINLSELLFENVTIRTIAPNSNVKKIFWEQVSLPTQIKKDKINILFNVHYTSLVFLGSLVKQVTLVPDLTYLRFFFQRKILKSLYITLMLPFSLMKAKEIISISEFTKKEIRTFFPFIPEKKILVMYLGLGNLNLKKTILADSNPLLKELGLQKNKFFIFVGTVEPTKNIYRCLAAFKLLLGEHPDYKFLIVGKRGWQDKKDSRFQKLKTFIQNTEMMDKVSFTGYIEPEDLGCLYHHACALVFASLNEGFGIPLLEAMECDIPVITSNISSMPEVAGEAALYVNPYSSEEIFRAMIKLIEDVHKRNELIEIGRIQKQNFSWDKSSEKIMHCFEGSK